MPRSRPPLPPTRSPAWPILHPVHPSITPCRALRCLAPRRLPSTRLPYYSASEREGAKGGRRREAHGEERAQAARKIGETYYRAKETYYMGKRDVHKQRDWGRGGVGDCGES